MAVAALGLHELRSGLRLGEHAHPELVRSSHGYLGTLTLLVAVIAAMAVAHLLVRLAIGWRSADGRRYVPHRTLRLWRFATIALLGVCFGQELLESFAATGHPPAVAGLLGHGGWTAIPLAILFGGAVALAVRGSDAVIALAARRRPEEDRQRPEHETPRLPAGHPRLHQPLAGLAAGRAPPLPPVAA